MLILEQEVEVSALMSYICKVAPKTFLTLSAIHCAENIMHFYQRGFTDKCLGRRDSDWVKSKLSSPDQVSRDDVPIIDSLMDLLNSTDNSRKL